jgi:Tfp pilus assembly PilM family ATPase
LTIDWDQRQLHLLAVRTQRKGMQAEWAADWDMGEDLTPRSAEAIGKRLREFLKAERIGAAAAIVALGRERVILKDIRYPAVSASEEPALVRFQATKDVTDPPDTLEVDHVQRPGGSGGERQALAVLCRRDVLNAVRALCRGAGIKLLGLAPRPFGAPYALQRTLEAGGGTFPGTSVQGVLTIGKRWAELCLFRGHELLLARSLPAGPVLVGEVKRSLAVFAAQNAADPQAAGPSTLYVFGNDQAPTTALAQALPCPVEVVSPLTIADAVAPREEEQGCLAGAVGLAQRYAVARSLPVNLAVSKKVQVSVSPARKRWLLYGVAAAVILLFGVGAMYTTLSKRKAMVAELTKEKVDLDADLAFYAQDRADIDGLKDWDQSAIPWLDELYDLTARFPYEKGFRINHVAIDPVVTKKKDAKDTKVAPKDVKDTKDPKDAKDAKDANVVAKITITGVSPSKEKDFLVQNLQAAMRSDSHLRPTIVKFPAGVNHEFVIRVDVLKQPATKYETILHLPPDLARAEPVRGKGKGRSKGGDDE